uniref:Uncharacterized protein n=1 Tax=Tanacetum cinerariifolium TaxID=118510 RepID=A0A699H360_TANCI|nr:hypothetical protein [Tanacetum cinerariifolium]
MHTYEQRLEMIFGRSVNWVHVLDFAGLTKEMRQTLSGRRRMPWRQFIFVLCLHSAEEMTEDGFQAYWLGSARVILDKGDLIEYWIEISSDKEFLGSNPYYVCIRDPVRRLCHRMISCNISSRGRALEKGRKSGARLSEGHFIGRLAAHFSLVSDEELRGLSAWVAPRPERQPAAAAGALEDVEGGYDEIEGDQAIPAPNRHLKHHLLPSPRLCLRGLRGSSKRIKPDRCNTAYPWVLDTTD